MFIKILFLALLMCAAYRDCRDRRIPNGCVAAVFLLAAAELILSGGAGLPEKFLGMFAVSVPMFLVTVLVPGAFGGGDIKLMAACGLYLGAPHVMEAFFAALCLGAVYGLCLLLCRGRSGREEFAFGPCLAAGAAMVVIFPLF